MQQAERMPKRDGRAGARLCRSLRLWRDSASPGLAPTPACTDVAAQQTCIEMATQQSCSNDAYLGAAAACATCGVPRRSGCASDADCQRYQPDYRCDLGRPGGYCTKACGSADDCSAVGPENCSPGRTPSFDPQAPAGQTWCILGCRAGLRIAESPTGYKCTMTGCDVPSP